MPKSVSQLGQPIEGLASRVALVNYLQTVCPPSLSHNCSGLCKMQPAACMTPFISISGQLCFD